MTAALEGRSLIGLIGPRGSGKSCVGRALAGRLGYSFADADALLEARAGQSIRAVFAAEGEAGFRDRESATLAEVCRLARHVVATGGGVVLRPANRDLLRRHAWVVWLTADVATLCRRLNQDHTTADRRPALTGAAGAASAEEVAALLAQREPLYRACADAIVTTAGRTIDAVADEIRDLWHDYRQRGRPAEPDHFQTVPVP